MARYYHENKTGFEKLVILQFKNTRLNVLGLAFCHILRCSSNKSTFYNQAE